MEDISIKMNKNRQKVMFSSFIELYDVKLQGLTLQDCWKDEVSGIINKITFGCMVSKHDSEQSKLIKIHSYWKNSNNMDAFDFEI